MTTPRYARIRYSRTIYMAWLVLSAFAGLAAIWCVVVGEWTWSMGWTVGALTLGAHARLEALEGHKHRNDRVEVP